MSPGTPTRTNGRAHDCSSCCRRGSRPAVRARSWSGWTIRAVRERLRGELAERGRAYAGRNPWDDLRLGALRTDAWREWEGRTLGELMAASGKDAVDAVCDLLIAEDLRPEPGDTRAGARQPGAVPGPSGVDGGHGLHVRGRQAVAADVGLVPAHPG